MLSKKMFKEDQIKFMCISHVDAGKSSLIGHFMYLTNNVDEHEFQKVKKEALLNNKNGFEYGYLVDIDSEERERGITIQSNIVEISYENINYTIIDCPGHKMYIREMIKSLSENTDSIVCVLISAVRNEFDSGFIGGTTKEDVLLAKACGIKHIIVLINKMDKIYNDEDSLEKYNYIIETFKKWIDKLNFKTVLYLPISGYLGWNITKEKEELNKFPKDSDFLINALKTIHQKRLNNQKKITQVIEIRKIKDKIKVEFYALNVSNIITSGYECILHIADSEIIGNVVIIQDLSGKTKKFLKTGDKAFLYFNLSENIEVYNNQKIIVRFQDMTVGFGNIMLKS